MNRNPWIAFMVAVVASVALGSSTVVAKDARLNNCTGTLLSFDTAKKACASGLFPGQTVVTCNSAGVERARRVCNSDGEKVGVYIGTCAGAATGFKDVEKACRSGGFDGQFLVRCNRGEATKRRQCESASPDGAKVQIFQTSCGSGTPLPEKSLENACKNNGGQILVKCRRRGQSWVAERSMFCEGAKDRLTIRNCSDGERGTLVSDYQWAEGRVDQALSDVESLLRTNYSMSSALRSRMEGVRRRLEKIQRAMDRPRTFICRANQNRCRRPVNAHVDDYLVRDDPERIRFCNAYFANPTQAERASIIVHEISHFAAETNDNGTEHGGCVSPVLAPAASNFHKQAEYYEHLVECGLYLPS